MSEASFERADELIRSAKPEDVNAGLEMLNRLESSETSQPETPEVAPIEQPKEIEQPEVSSENLETKPPEEAPDSSLKIQYRGEDFSQPDNDGFLGRKDLDGLKQANVHKEAHIKWQDSELEKARLKIAELGKVQQPTLPQQTSAPKQDALPVENTKVERPARPVKPTVGNDAAYWSAEEEKSMSDYHTAIQEYDTNLDNYLDYLGTKQTVDPRFEKYDKMVEAQEQKAQTHQAQLDEDAYWNNIEVFRKTHSEYNEYRGTMKDLHKEVNDWMSRLANASGYNLPLSPTAEDVAQFEATKQQVAKRYEAGEQALVDTGVAPPDGYKEYYALGDLESERDTLVRDKVLGPNADLQVAWLQRQNSSGALEQGISELEVNARKRGTDNVLNVMGSQQANNAQTIPNSANQQVPATGTGGLTPDRKLEILNMSPTALMQSPELQKTFDEIVASM